MAPEKARYPRSPMGDFDRGYPTGLRRRAADDGRGLEVVSGKACNAGRTNIRRLPSPPGARRRAGRASYTSSGPAPLWAADAEARRRRRVAGYKLYEVERKVKASIRKGLRWIKGLVRGW